MAASEQPDYSKALSLLGKVPLIDGHNDWAMYIRDAYGNKIDEQFDKTKALSGHQDMKRLLQGKVGGIFWSVFIACPDQDKPDHANDFSDEFHFEPLRDTMQQIDLVYRLIDKYPEHLELVQRSEDILRIHKSGKVASMLGTEGLHQIGNSPAVLRNYHRLGVRYVTLAHNSNNPYADCAIKPPVHGGLSEAGKRMIQEMNRIGMMIDLSHVSEAVMVDALSISKAPVAFTHSNCFALCPHPRNAPDHVLSLLKKNNGILMVTFVPKFVRTNLDEASIEHVVDHVQHAASLMGYDHIGVGSDFGGMPRGVHGLEDVTTFPRFVNCLLSRGISDSDVEKILGLNIIRVLKGVEDHAKMSTLEVLEEDVKYVPL